MINQAKRSNFSLKKDDQVKVIAGREKGKSGKLLSVNWKTGRVVVEKVNMVKKHTKAQQGGTGGGIFEKEGSIHYSNVLLHCPKCDRGVRHGMKRVEKKVKAGGSKKATAQMVKVRVCKRCSNEFGAA